MDPELEIVLEYLCDKRRRSIRFSDEFTCRIRSNSHYSRIDVDGHILTEVDVTVRSIHCPENDVISGPSAKRVHGFVVRWQSSLIDTSGRTGNDGWVGHDAGTDRRAEWDLVLSPIGLDGSVSLPSKRTAERYRGAID